MLGFGKCVGVRLGSINPGYAALQDMAIPLNQITFVAIYFALTAFALCVGCRLFL